MPAESSVTSDPSHTASSVSWVVVMAGMTAALHVGKLPPALPVLGQSLGISLVQAGFLLSLVQLAGMSLGVFVGLSADGLGLRRSMLAGLVLLTLASALGSGASTAQSLMAWRALEGVGFLLTVMPAPGLIRRHTPAQLLAGRLGWWGSYMPTGSATALLLGPWVMQLVDWSGWWLLLSAVSALTALIVWQRVPADPPSPKIKAKPWPRLLLKVLRSPPAWCVALCFAVYSSQWLSVVGFMPTVTHEMGWSTASAGAFTALVALVNVSGNVGAGRLLQRGWAPRHLLWLGFSCMALGALMAFAPQLPLGLRLVSVLGFSACGGLIPGTLFSMAVRLAPSEDTVSSTVGWVQQLSAMGQLCGPPIVAWLAARAGGWQYTGLACAACCAVGAVLTWAIHRSLQHQQSGALAA